MVDAWCARGSDILTFKLHRHHGAPSPVLSLRASREHRHHGGFQGFPACPKCTASCLLRLLWDAVPGDSRL